MQVGFYQQYIHPFYERHIQPLNKWDYSIVSGSLATAALITAVATHFFGVAVFPLAIGLSSLLVMGACKLSRSRVQTYFNNIAWNKLDLIRTNISDNHAEWNAIADNLTELNRGVADGRFNERIKPVIAGIEELRAKNNQRGGNYQTDKVEHMTKLTNLQRELNSHRQIT